MKDVKPVTKVVKKESSSDEEDSEDEDEDESEEEEASKTPKKNVMVSLSFLLYLSEFS